jgi:flagellin
METSMARLSSGKRINSASDDAAGVAISSRLSAEIRGTDQAIRNALDGQALIDTAEGAHSEIENILQRMREVSVQAANDTNNDQDRANLQAEMSALVTEIDRIAGTTTWAGEKLMEAESGTKFSFQVGAKTSNKNQIEININGMGAHALGLQADPADITYSLNDVVVGQSANIVSYSIDGAAALDTRQASISALGVVTANHGNTSITLPKLGNPTDNTPTFNTSTGEMQINAQALVNGFTLTLETGAHPVTVTAAPNGSLADLKAAIDAGTGTVKGSGATTGAAAYTLTTSDISGGENFTGNLMASITADGNITLTKGGVEITAAVTSANSDAANASAITTAFSAYGVTAHADDSAGTGVDGQGIHFEFAEVYAVSTDEGHGYSASIAAGVLTVAAAGEITVSGGVSSADSGSASLGAASVAMSGGHDVADVEYDPTDATEVNRAVDEINAGTAYTNIHATVGAAGSGENAGKIILSHVPNGGTLIDGSSHTTVTGIGTHSDLTTVFTSYDTDKSEVAATQAGGVITFNETAGTAFKLVLGLDATTGQPGSNSEFTINTDADLQAAVDNINDGAGLNDSGDGTAEHGYTASIVAAADGSPVNGTIKLIPSTPTGNVVPVSLANLDLGAIGYASDPVSSDDGSYDAATGVFTPGTANTTGTVNLTLGDTEVTVSGISNKGADASGDAAKIAAAISAGNHGYTAAAMTGADTGKVKITQPSAPTKDMDVNSADKARESIVAIDAAIQTVNIQRSSLGAVSNRLSHTINNLTNISSNLSAAQGGIEDADFAHETTMLAKNQILQQASTAMLAQANASKQNVLSLLQG